MAENGHGSVFGLGFENARSGWCSLGVGCCTTSCLWVVLMPASPRLCACGVPQIAPDVNRQAFFLRRAGGEIVKRQVGGWSDWVGRVLRDGAGAYLP